MGNLGEPVELEQGAAEDAFELAVERGRHHVAAGGAEPEAAARRSAAGRLQQHPVHAGHAHDHRDLPRRDARQRLLGPEAVLEQDRRARADRREALDDGGVDEGERHRHEQAVLGGDPPVDPHRLRDHPEVPVRVDDPLRVPRAPRREEDHGRLGAGAARTRCLVARRPLERVRRSHDQHLRPAELEPLGVHDSLEARVEHQRTQANHVHDARDLCGRVCGIDRDGDGPDPREGVEGEEPFGAIRHQQADEVARLDPAAGERGRLPGRGGLELAERPPAVAEYERRPLGPARGSGRDKVGSPHRISMATYMMHSACRSSNAHVSFQGLFEVPPSRLYAR